MNTYIFRAALYCEECALKARDEIRRMETPDGLLPGIPLKSESDDSDDFPQGPYPDGGGEADTVQCCDDCQCLLENPLTADGYRYTAEMALDDWQHSGERINTDFWRDVIETYPEVFDDVSQLLKDKLAGRSAD